MKINFMRFIDFRLGVPICFILSCLHGLRKIFSKPRLMDKPTKICFIELSEMGSIVLAYSLFKKTKELIPEAELYFLTFEENRHAVDILEIIPEENIVTISSKNFYRFLITAIGALRRMRRERLSLTVDMELFARLTAILSYLSGAKNRAGYHRYHNEGLYRGNFLTHKVMFNPHIHMTHNLLNLIYAVTSHQEDTPLSKKPLAEKEIEIPKIKVKPEAKERIMARLEEESKSVARSETIILLNPNSSDIVPLRKWPIENYIQLAQRLLKHKSVSIVITGVASEREYADSICSALGSEKCINFAGKTSFSELIELYSVADILITNDSGPVHFATLTDIMIFAFFGPETPRLYGPLGTNCRVFYANYACSPCISAFNHRKSPCDDNRCLKAISVDEVYEEVKKHLDRL